MAPRNDNRDWFTRADQGFGRSSHDYGHTYFEPDVEPWPRWQQIAAIVIGGIMALIAVYAAVQGML
jgi:hypothetical protein